MAYIPDNLKWSKEFVSEINIDPEYSLPSIEYLIGIHHAFYKDDPEFDGGLNFLDKLFAKLEKPFGLVMDIPKIKEYIRYSNNPKEAYLAVLNSFLTEDMRYYYGY